MRELDHLVEAAAHVELAAFAVDEGRVDRHAERMDRSARRIGDVLAQARAVEEIPQLDLDAMRPQRIENEQAMTGRVVGEPRDRHLQTRRRLPMQEGAIERTVQIAADEVAHARVAKVDRDSRQAREAAKLRMREDVFAADGHGAIPGTARIARRCDCGLIT